MLRSGRLALVLLLLATSANAGPRLVPISASAVAAPQSSWPWRLTRVGSRVIFTARDEAHGWEPWVSDGTAEGTRVIDLVPGPVSSNAWIEGVFGEAVLISTWRDNEYYSGRTIWRSDGTEAGTWTLGFVGPPKPGSSADVTVVPAGNVAYVVSSKYGTGDFWVTDGAPGSLRKIGSFPFDPTTKPAGIDGKVFFAAQESKAGWRVWVSDGTIAGTHIVDRGTQSIASSSNNGTAPPSAFFTLRGRAYFVMKDGIYVTDGTPEGTMRAVATEAEPRSILVSSDGRFAWLITPKENIRLDGTTGGTRRSTHDYTIGLLILEDGRLLHWFWNGSGAQLALTDGTPEGTTLFDSFRFDGSGELVGTVGSQVYLAPWSREIGNELWMTDLNLGGLRLLKDLFPGRSADAPRSGYPSQGVALGGKLLFTADSPAGRELWISDGTPAGTTLLANIAADVPSGTISGTVRDAAMGVPIAGAKVTLCSSLCEDVVSTSASGAYRIDGVPPGAYTLRADEPEHFQQQASGVGVTAGFETAGVDFTLPKGGTISGRVTRAKTGAPIERAEVVVRSVENGAVADRIAQTKPDGSYRTRGLAPGLYVVEAHPLPNYGASPAVDQVYAGRSCSASQGCGAAGSDPVVVTGGQEAAGIDFALHEYGTISGTLREAASGIPAGEMTVSFTPVRTSKPIASAVTDGLGRYQSPLLAEGMYQVTVNAARGYDAAAAPSAVTLPVDGAVTGVDLRLTQKSRRLSGIVTDVHGTPVPGVLASLFTKSGDPVLWARTDETGRYVFSGFEWLTGPFYLKAGDELVPGVDCPTYQCNVAGATPIEVTAPETKIVDIRLHTPWTVLRGHVREATTGKVITYPDVTAYRTDGQAITRAESKSDGSFTLAVTGREAGFYVAATAYPSVRIAYPNARPSCINGNCTFPPEAKRFAAGESMEIDFVLPRTGAISGRVFDAETGRPVAGLPVRFLPAGGDPRDGVTDADGKYRWSFATGPARVVASPGSSTYAEGSADIPNVPEAGEVAGIDFFLRPLQPNRGKIRGRVVDAITRAGMANVSVWASSATAGASGKTDAEGYFTLPEGIATLTDETYSVSADAGPPYLLSKPATIFAGWLRAVPAAPVELEMVKLQAATVSPSSGPAAGGTKITISGANFPAIVSVTIGEKAAKIVSVTPSEIVAVTPPGTAGPAHVIVSAAYSWSIVLGHAYLYQ